LEDLLMSDAVAMQPIAQGLLTIDAAGDPIITGDGFSSVSRVTALGDFLLDLDLGTGVEDVGSGSPFIVNGQAVPGIFPDGRIGPNGIDPNRTVTSMTMRGNSTDPLDPATPGSTTVASMIFEFVAPSPGEGATQLRIFLRDSTDAATDPMGAGVPTVAGSGVEIMIWSLASVDNVTQQLVGPLFQGAMQFP
jgi:hypothetical protein